MQFLFGAIVGIGFGVFLLALGAAMDTALDAPGRTDIEMSRQRDK
jgi:hypothetical protein